MRTWEYFYVRHCVEIAEKWEKKPGWSVWDGCFDYLSICPQSLNKGQYDFMIQESNYLN